MVAQQNPTTTPEYPIAFAGYRRPKDTTDLAIFPVAPKQTLPYANCKDCEHHMARALEPDSHERHRSVPLQDTMTRIPGYPRKLVIFKIPASSYWWVRYYASARVFTRQGSQVRTLYRPPAFVECNQRLRRRFRRLF